jgi:hypothetical protein
LEKIIKPVPTIGGGAEIATVDGVVCTIADRCSVAFNNLLFVDFP